jgi:hypothetical protein
VNDDSELESELTAHERELADQLDRDRPAPAAGFRGALGRYLTTVDPGYGPRPPRLRVIVSGYVAGGAVLLTLGVLQATGAL